MAGMAEVIDLVLDCFDQTRMTVAGVDHRDPCGKVDETIAFAVPQFGILGTGREKRRRNPDSTRDGAGTACRKFCIGHGICP